MKKFEFNHVQRRWDQHKCFYYTEGPFTEFQTGEVIVRYLPDPDYRRHYAKYNIQLVTTTDANCPTLYTDKACKEPALKAWLTQGGQQHLAIDHERKVAVALREGWGAQKANLQFLASHLDDARAVWMGPERLPIPLAKITVSQPDNNVKKELASKLAEVRAAVTAAARIKGLQAAWGVDKMGVQAEWADMSVEDIYAYVCADDNWMRMVVTNGFAYPRLETKHDFLYIK